MIKNIVRTAIVLTLMLLTMTAWVQVVLSGYCGDPSVNGGQNVTYEVSDSQHHYNLIIRGSGPMRDYSSENDLPWKDYVTIYESPTTAIFIEGDITHVGAYTFWHCMTEDFKIPASVTSIGKLAFYDCHSVTLTIPAGVTEIPDAAFNYNVFLIQKEAYV